MKMAAYTFLTIAVFYYIFGRYGFDHKRAVFTSAVRVIHLSFKLVSVETGAVPIKASKEFWWLFKRRLS